MKPAKIISELPSPFKQELSPYKKFKFSETIVSICSTYFPVVSCLRVGKVIILGDLGVGKTSLVNRFCHQIYNYNYKATIGVDFEMEQFEILKVPFNLQIWDTAGQERFRCIAAAYYRNAHAIVTVFDLRNQRSLQNCILWMKEAMECNTDEPLRFLVGTKMDLLSDSMYQCIEKEAGEMASLMGAEYWSVSSKTGDQVSELFYRIAALCFEHMFHLDANFNENDSLQLGRSLRDSSKPNRQRKKNDSCGIGTQSCRF